MCAFVFADVIQLKQEGGKQSSFFSTSIKNIISKGAAEVSHHDLILDWKYKKTPALQAWNQHPKKAPDI